MTKEQDFPISIEAQLLGGLSDGKARPTREHVLARHRSRLQRARLYPQHCLVSASKTYDGDQWVQMELVVLGDAQITHLVNGEKVLEYSLPQIGGGVVANFDPKAKRDGELLSGGYIALQSESHPLDVRKIELLDLDRLHGSQERQLPKLLRALGYRPLQIDRASAPNVRRHAQRHRSTP